MDSASQGHEADASDSFVCSLEHHGEVPRVEEYAPDDLTALVFALVRRPTGDRTDVWVLRILEEGRSIAFPPRPQEEALSL